MTGRPGGASETRRPPSGHEALVIGPLPPPAHGASVVTAAVTGRLAATGRCVTVDTSVPGAGPGYHARRAARHARAALAVVRHRRDARVYLTGVGGHALLYQLGIIAVCRAAGVPAVYHHHSYAYLTRRSRAMAALVRVGGPAVHHVTLSAGMAELLRRRYPRAVAGSVCSNVHFLPSPVAGRDEPARLAARPPAPLRLGHLGNLTLDKGLGRVVDAFRSVRAAGLPAELHLAGPVADQAAGAVLRTALAEHPDVDYRGALARDEVPAFMRSIDVFLFPSTYRNEAQPLVVLEALLEGVPVLALPVGCLADLRDADGRPLPDAATFGPAVVELARRRAAGDPALGPERTAAWARRQLADLGDAGPTFLELLHA